MFTMPHRDYVIPPGLFESVLLFRAHYEAANGEPVLIEGPTGVGKRMFIDIFKILYREQHGDQPPIVTINCSHFGGDLARSELFGYVKGAFTGALKDKIGLVKTADTGLLILEEIGDLSPETQAKLLTFIEDKVYYRVGDVTPIKANVQILGATNHVKDLRDDFRYRFFRFSIPPLYQRRGDVLYYLDAKFPGLVRRLSPSEILALIAYNWPGNVREIDTFGRILYREKYLQLASDELLPPTRRLSIDEMAQGRVNLYYAEEIRENLIRLFHIEKLVGKSSQFNRININGILEEVLVSLRFDNEMPIDELIKFDPFRDRLISHFRHHVESYTKVHWPFRNGNKIDHNESELAIQDIMHFKISEGGSTLRSTMTTINITPIISGIFEEIRHGLSIYCAFFFQNSSDDKNLTDVTTGCSLPGTMMDIVNYRNIYMRYAPKPNCIEDDDILSIPFFKTNPDRLEYLFPPKSHPMFLFSRLEVELFEALSGIKLDENIHALPYHQDDRKKFFLKLIRRYPNNKFLESLVPMDLRDQMDSENEKPEEPRITAMSYDQFLRWYYESLSKATNGNVARASKIAGVKHQTFNSRLKRLKIRFKTPEL